MIIKLKDFIEEKIDNEIIEFDEFYCEDNNMFKTSVETSEGRNKVIHLGDSNNYSYYLCWNSVFSASLIKRVRIK